MFAEGDEVVVYDNKSKLSTDGKIIEVMGNNNYLVECGKGPQHISGDCISLIPAAANREIGNPDVQQQQIDGDNPSGEFSQEDDNVSVMFESSMGSDIVAAIPDDVMGNHPQAGGDVPRGRRRRRIDQLGPACPYRLRPRPG